MTAPHPLDLSGLPILVTGASSGIGRETAIALSELGAHVVLTGRNPVQLEATLERMVPGPHVCEAFDLGELEAIPELVKALAARCGPLAGLVHAAGFRKTVGLRGMSVEMLHETFRVNVDSAVMLAKGFRQKGCNRAPSSIVFMSSASALAGGPGMAAYSASKAALIGLTRSLACELAGEGIRVNCIAAGMVQSEMSEQIRRTVGEEAFARIVAQHPLGLGTARDVAWASAYLLSPAARWMTGHTLVLDGGFTAQ